MSSANRKIHRKILAIKPVHHDRDGSAIVILDDETHTISACDLLFAENQIELASRTRQFWEIHIGGQYEPKALCIEYPRRYLGQATFIMSYLCAYLEHKFSPQLPLRPRSQAWKRITNTKTTLSEQARSQLTSISCMQKEDVHNAINMALWAREKILKHESDQH